MDHKDYKNIAEFKYVGGGFVPLNQQAQSISERLRRGDIVSFKEVTARDLSFHRCYMSLLSYIYDLLPQNFRDKVAKGKFYFFLKHLHGDYDVVFEFKDGIKMVEYRSISFGRMSQDEFEAYIADQLPFIYDNLIVGLFPEDMANGIIQDIEDEYEKFLSKL